MNYIKALSLFAAMLFTATSLNAQNDKQASSTDGMFIRGNQVYYIKGGQVNKLPAGQQDLAGNAKITAFGKITMADGTVHQLAAGELVDFSGKITDIKVEEYVTMQNGSAIVVTNGIVSPIDVGFKFGDDKQIDANGTLSDGQKLIDGQKMDMNGQFIK